MIPYLFNLFAKHADISLYDKFESKIGLKILKYSLHLSSFGILVIAIIPSFLRSRKYTPFKTLTI